MDSTLQKRYLTLDELVEQSGLSESTIHRLKRDGKIPFYQPAGKHGRLLFPADALEQGISTSAELEGAAGQPKRLSGPQPKWLKD